MFALLRVTRPRLQIAGIEHRNFRDEHQRDEEAALTTRGTLKRTGKELIVKAACILGVRSPSSGYFQRGIPRSCPASFLDKSLRILYRLHWNDRFSYSGWAKAFKRYRLWD